MTLALGDLMKNSYNPEFSLALSRSVTETTWPWLPFEMTTFIDYNIDEDKHRITVELFFNERKQWMYWFQMDWDRDMNEEQTLWALCTSLHHNFRHWRDTEPEDNIKLGEN